MNQRAFVIMPFGTKTIELAAGKAAAAGPTAKAAQLDCNLLYAELIEPALRAAGVEPHRADETEAAGDIRTDMFFEIVTADLAVADLSAHNPNVFYELGVRHGVAPRGVLLLNGKLTERVFDLGPDRMLDYDGTLFLSGAPRDDAWRARVREEVATLSGRLRAWIAADPGRVGSPVYEHLPGLTPADWRGVEKAQARFFHGVLDDWKRRVRRARERGRPGDILTLAEDAPTAWHQRQYRLEAARVLVDLRRFELAREVYDQVLEDPAAPVDAACLRALALNRLGERTEALDAVKPIARDLPGHPEAQGVIGRVYKDLWRERWESGADPAARRDAARTAWPLASTALASYALALHQDLDTYYNGINVATLLALREALGVPGAEADLLPLGEIVTIVRAAARASGERAAARGDAAEQVWTEATLGELAVIEDHADDAAAHYSRAVLAPEVTYFQLDSMRSQLELFTKLDARTAAARRALEPIESAIARVPDPTPASGRVLVFAGHMTDGPGRAAPRFPDALAPAAARRIEAALARWGFAAGDLAIGGGARGADTLVAEACLARGVNVRRLLSNPVEEFVQKSVRGAAPEWEQRFRDLDARFGHEVQGEVLGDSPEGGNVYERNNLWCLHTARVEAAPGRLHALVVWDEQPTGDGPGGTSHFVKALEGARAQLEVVNPRKL